MENVHFDMGIIYKKEWKYCLFSKQKHVVKKIFGLMNQEQAI